MRLTKHSDLLIAGAQSRFLMVADALDGDVHITKEDKTVFALTLGGDHHVSVKVLCGKDALCLSAENAWHQEVIVTQGYASLRLYVGGVLEDEVYFTAPSDLDGGLLHTDTYLHFENGYEYHSMAEAGICSLSMPSPNGFRPYGRERELSHVVPALLGERLHLFYLDERHRNGRRQLCALYTVGDGTYGTAPTALAIDAPHELRIADACCICTGGRYYLYYIADTLQGRRVMCAVSEDGFSFAKTNLDIQVPHMQAAAVTALQVYEKAGNIYLLYTENGEGYVARSLDLLHFDNPEKQDFPCRADGFYTLQANGKTWIFAQQSLAQTVYFAKTDEGYTSPTTVKGGALSPRIVLYRGELILFGHTVDGRMIGEPFALTE